MDDRNIHAHAFSLSPLGFSYWSVSVVDDFNLGIGTIVVAVLAILMFPTKLVVTAFGMGNTAAGWRQSMW